MNCKVVVVSVDKIFMYLLLVRAVYFGPSLNFMSMFYVSSGFLYMMMSEVICNSALQIEWPWLNWTVYEKRQ